ncbi:MAG: DSD1 family PLP-dependent enzyme [Planctomycetes bacterium]|nr:DSD1 family PLP-dependent enzyme [Planctomycetota bacterium]
MASVIGSAIEELDTPALLLDKAAFERNLGRMAGFFAGRRAQLRPHFKNHKCTELAKRQLAAGSAVGITCAKLGEAEVLVEAGIDDVLIANQVMGPAKVDRLAALARRAKVRVAVDHADQVEGIARAAERAGSTVGLLIEVEIGMGRCGVMPGEPALELARCIVGRPGVRFDGLQAYEGHLVAVKDRAERERRVWEAFAPAVATRRAIEAAGMPVAVISGGSTSTYAITGQIDGIEEIQAGTYPTMDWMYRELAPEFEIALSVLARVISRPAADRAVLDVGLKGLGHEFGPPKAKGHLDADMPFHLSEEHCTGRSVPDWPLGSLVELVPSHSCTTCNLYRQIHVHERGRVVDVWPHEGSGRPL